MSIIPEQRLMHISEHTQMQISEQELILKGIDLIEKQEYSKSSIKELILKGIDLIEKQEYSKSIEFFDKVLKYEENVYAFMYKGLAFFHLNDYNSSNILYNKALELDPTNELVLIYKGLLLQAENKNSEALNLYDQALKFNPLSHSALNNKANILNLMDRNEEALNLYDEALKNNPHYIDVLINKAALFDQMKRYEESEKIYQWLIENEKKLINESSLPILYYNNSKLLRQIGKLEDALKSINIAIKLKPDSLKYLAEKGIILIALNRDKDAIKCLNEVVTKDPKEYNSFMNIGVALAKLGEDALALQYFEKALAIEPNYVLGLKNKIVVMKKLGLTDGLSESISKVLSLVPDDFDSLLDMCELFFKAESYTEALKYIDKILSIDSKHTNSLINKGIILRKLKAYKKALEYYDKVLHIESSNEIALYEKATLLQYELKRPEEALECYYRIQETNPSEFYKVYSYYNIGIIFESFGNYDRALQFYDKALVINRNNHDISESKDKLLRKMKKNSFNKNIPSPFNHNDVLIIKSLICKCACKEEKFNKDKILMSIIESKLNAYSKAEVELASQNKEHPYNKLIGFCLEWFLENQLIKKIDENNKYFFSKTLQIICPIIQKYQIFDIEDFIDSIKYKEKIIKNDKNYNLIIEFVKHFNEKTKEFQLMSSPLNEDTLNKLSQLGIIDISISNKLSLSLFGYVIRSRLP
jgi:tetratricopeptide (TPR) repeat protein